MKKIISIIALAVAFTACKTDSSKEGAEAVDDFSDKQVNQIISYYNAVIAYNAEAGKKIQDLEKRDFAYLEEMAEKKTKTNRVLTWTSFIGSAPRTSDGFGDEKVDILEPSKFMEDDLAKKVKPAVDSMVNAYNAIYESYNAYKDYYRNEDYKDDNWAKASELVAAMDQNAVSYYANKAKFYDYVLPLVEKAEERILADHPLKKEILFAKKTMSLVDDIIGTIDVENVNMETLEKQYTDLEARYNEGVAMDTKALEEHTKASQFKNFFDRVNDFLGELRKAKRDGNISDSDYNSIVSDYNSVINNYNYFVD